MSDENNNVQLYLALHRAQQIVGAVAKTSTNAHQRYQYASAEDMLKAARAALNEAGVVVMRQGYTLDRNVARDGEVIIDVRQTFYVIHAESGQHVMHDVVFPAVVGKGRPDDKAVAGALTSGLSYYMRDLLLIPRVDESEMDRRDDRDYQPQAQSNNVGGAIEWLQGIGYDAAAATKIAKGCAERFHGAEYKAHIRSHALRKALEGVEGNSPGAVRAWLEAEHQEINPSNLGNAIRAVSLRLVREGVKPVDLATHVSGFAPTSDAEGSAA